jgi:hypothetical protein
MSELKISDAARGLFHSGGPARTPSRVEYEAGEPLCS